MKLISRLIRHCTPTKKSIDNQVERLAKLLGKLEELEKITKKNKSNFHSPPKTTAFLNELKSLQLMGRDRPLNRQVGAWQSNKITPHSVLKSAIKFSKARLTVPSTQDWLLIKNGEKLMTNLIRK